MYDTRQQEKRDEPLIIYTDDDGSEKKVYSNYTIKDGVITFKTQQNEITLPLTRLIKIKEAKNGN